MKRKITALILIFALALSGCCYAPGNERASFMEKWLKLPSMSMGDYQTFSYNSSCREGKGMSIYRFSFKSFAQKAASPAAAFSNTSSEQA